VLSEGSKSLPAPEDAVRFGSILLRIEEPFQYASRIVAVLFRYSK
jgi:hypothetical protein